MHMRKHPVSLFFLNIFLFFYRHIYTFICLYYLSNYAVRPFIYDVYQFIYLSTLSMHLFIHLFISSAYLVHLSVYLLLLYLASCLCCSSIWSSFSSLLLSICLFVYNFKIFFNHLPDHSDSLPFIYLSFSLSLFVQFLSLFSLLLPSSLPLSSSSYSYISPSSAASSFASSSSFSSFFPPPSPSSTSSLPHSPASSSLFSQFFFFYNTRSKQQDFTNFYTTYHLSDLYHFFIIRSSCFFFAFNLPAVFFLSSYFL